jgi:acyl carrier protein
MTNEDIEGRVRKLMVELWGVETTRLERPTLLARDLGVDSLDLVEMVMAMEDEFGVEIPDDEIDGRLEDHSVGDVLDVALKYVLPLAA